MLIFAKSFLEITRENIWMAIILGLFGLWQTYRYYTKLDRSTEGLSSECKLLIRWLHKNEIDMFFEDGQLKFDPPNAKVPKKIKQKVIENQAELVEFVEKFGRLRDT